MHEGRTGTLAESVLGGREAPLRTGADEMTPVAYQRVRFRPHLHYGINGHLLNLNSVMFLESILRFCITLERELARAHLHIVEQTQSAQGAVCVFVFGESKVLQ
jgi:hypothetical protein